MIVDASAMVELLLGRRKADVVEAHLRSAVEGLDAPHLIDVEIASALRRLALRGELSETRAALALDAQAQFPLRRHPHAPLLSRLWHWRNTLSAYDALYVALAEALNAPLVTCDARLGKAAGNLVAVALV